METGKHRKSEMAKLVTSWIWKPLEAYRGRTCSKMNTILEAKVTVTPDRTIA